MAENPYIGLFLVFTPLSLVAIGGGQSVITEMQYQAVQVHHWMDSRTFLQAFAISRAAPGPGSMLSTLVGWQLAGWGGALVATLSMFLPSSVLCYGILRLSHRFRGRAWHTALQNGLAPIGGGLILASVLTISRLSGSGALAWMITTASVTLLLLYRRCPPLLIFALGALCYIGGRQVGL
ncbi:chromate transporter [soil metagenome]